MHLIHRPHPRAPVRALVLLLVLLLGLAMLLLGGPGGSESAY